MKIDKDVKMPIYHGRSPYPFRDMEVGDSVFFDEEPFGSQSRPVAAARKWGKNRGVRFSARREGYGVRIWRVR